ncbi:choice-of-anchor Q domain-containing protein [Chloroflexota bacterium]
MVILVDQDIGVTISQVTIRHGNMIEGGGGIRSVGYLTLDHVHLIANNAFSVSSIQVCGGGVHSAVGFLTIRDSLVSGNTVTANGGRPGYGGGVCAYSGMLMERTTVSGNQITGIAYELSGGGVFAGGALQIADSAIIDNQAERGGGVFTYNDIQITNTTISENHALVEGGGIWVGAAEARTLSLTHTTVYSNTAQTGGGISIDNDYTAELNNAIVAGNIAEVGPDIYNLGAANCLGTLLVGDVSGLTFGGGCTLMSGLDPLLLPLGYYGGPTPGHLPQQDSPVLDISGCAELAADQRGLPRPVDLPAVPNEGEACDLGAMERQFRIYIPLVYRMSSPVQGSYSTSFK